MKLLMTRRRLEMTMKMTNFLRLSMKADERLKNEHKKNEIVEVQINASRISNFLHL
jgi:hypothetical protein